MNLFHELTRTVERRWQIWATERITILAPTFEVHVVKPTINLMQVTFTFISKSYYVWYQNDRLAVICWSYLYLYMMRSKVTVYLPQSKFKSWRSNVSQILRYASWVCHIMYVCYSSYALVILTADLHGVMQRNESICTDFQQTAAQQLCSM